jgi:hypothetical protein
MKLTEKNIKFLSDFSLSIRLPVKSTQTGFDCFKTFPVDVLDEKDNLFDQSKIINYILYLNIEQNINPQDVLRQHLFEFFAFNQLKLKQKYDEKFKLESQFINLDYHTLMNKVVNEFIENFRIYNQLIIGRFYYCNFDYIFHAGEVSFDIINDTRIIIPKNKFFYDVTGYVNISLN